MALGAVVALIALAAGGWFFLEFREGRKLAEAIAEADRTDPKWRLADLEAARELIPDDQNAAIVAANVRGLMTGPFPPPVGGTPGPFGKPIPDDMTVRLLAPTPDERLTEPLAAELRDVLAKESAALALAARLRDLPRGRFPLVIAPNPIMTVLGHIEADRHVSRLLQAEAFRRAQDGDPDGALDACRDILGTARGIGDEPFLISQLVRMTLDEVAMATVQRVLAQGRPSDAALARLQEALLDESRNSWLLAGLRGERATMNVLMEKIGAGEITLGQINAMNGGGPPEFLAYGPAFYVHNHALMLSLLNRSIAIARSSAVDQLRLWKEFEAELRPSDSGLEKLSGSLAYSLYPAFGAVLSMQPRVSSNLRASAAIVAAERHRIAHGAMPRSLAEIDPRLLDAIPIDPFDGLAMKSRWKDGSLSVYTVGPDGLDDGGKFDPRMRMRAGTDLGWTLWDVPFRARTPREELPEDVFAR